MALNEPPVVERHDHAVDGGRRDPEEVLKVTLGRRATVQYRVGVDEGQVLPLRRGEGDRHAGPSVIRCVAEGRDARTIPRRAGGERASAIGGDCRRWQRAVRRVKRAQILLAAAAGETDAEIATTVRVGTSTVYRTKQQFVERWLRARR